jgi:hypothetical protein
MKRIATKRMYATMSATMAILLLSGGLALAQGLGGYPPGVNPSNPNDLTNRSNPQDLTLPGASNPQEWKASEDTAVAGGAAPHAGSGRAPSFLRETLNLLFWRVRQAVSQDASRWQPCNLVIYGTLCCDEGNVGCGRNAPDTSI